MFHTTSPRTDDAGIETLIQLKGKTAPRVTPADVEANIASEHYFTGADGVLGADEDGKHLEAPLALGLLTFCVLVLKNGFTVTGESACASPENFDAEIGRRIARENAKQKIWPLMGYELRTKLMLKSAEPREYTWQDIVRVRTERDVSDLHLRFSAQMADGKKIVGTIPGFLDLDQEAGAQAILDECNRLARGAA